MRDWLIGLAVVAGIALFATWLFAPHILEPWINRLFMY